MDNEVKNEKQMLSILNKCYGLALNGLPKTESVYEIADNYKSKYPESNEKAAKELVKWQIVKCGTSGFLTGFGGLVTLPVAIPANVSSVLYVQLRMIASIALIGGYDLQDDSIQSLVYLCLVGTAINDVVKQAGITIGEKIAIATIKKKISGEVIKKINQRVGFRLVTKFGEKGIINLAKLVPIVGGGVGAAFDITSTKIIAENAIKIFLKGEISDE